MKQKISLVFLIAIFSFQLTIAQDSVRTVIKTPRNGHSIYKFKGANDKVGLYYIDDEKTPFTGKFIEKGWDREKKSERNYTNGVLEGDYIEWTKRGDSEYIKTKGTYKNGKLFGNYTEWWRANHKKKECFYDSNGEFHGKMIHYEGFSVEEPPSIQFYNHGKRDSTWTWFYSGGKIKSVQNYKNGKDHGDSIEYYKNGNKKEEIKYVDDKKVDTQKRWYEDGQLKYTCEYQAGKRNGKEIYYYKNGQIEKEGEYMNGDKKGHFVWYKSDGTIEEETTY
ncbi:MAG: toxin-antitoxin system YwqK family antitoxin [Ekhidna sp.]|nr:toxin-antitoxin system YwqK family antitoxin [Ekhidna sp.]